MKGLFESYWFTKMTDAQKVEHLFSVLGNGINMDSQGYITGNYKSEKAYDFVEVTPIANIYPWSENEQFQPFRKYAGCRDVGFKEAAKYFIDCLEATPDTVERIGPWKANIDVIRDVLLNTPTIEYKVGIEMFEGSPKDQLKKVWFLDAQVDQCPDIVVNEVRDMWTDYSLGNDNYFVKREVDEELKDDYPAVYHWLKYQGVPEGETVHIHWWW
jgi:hypothetical protein